MDTKKSYHCTADCLREHWTFHKDFHQNSRENNGGELLRLPCLPCLPAHAHEPGLPPSKLCV